MDDNIIASSGFWSRLLMGLGTGIVAAFFFWLFSNPDKKVTYNIVVILMIGGIAAILGSYYLEKKMCSFYESINKKKK